MRDDRNEPIRRDRRRFLKNAALTGAAVGVGAGAGSALAFDREVEREEKRLKAEGKPGYRETEHIRKYYQKADF